MRYWNYRIVYKKGSKTSFESFSIHEVYYSKKGKIINWTEASVPPFGETKKALKRNLKYFKKALKKSILTEKIIKNKIRLIEVNSKAKEK